MCHAAGWRDRYGVKSLSPNLIIVKFTFDSQEYKMDLSCGENRQKWVPLFYYTVKNCLRVCGLFLEKAKHHRGMIWRGGLAHLDEALEFHCFHFKDEWVDSLSTSSETVCFYSTVPQPFSFFNVFCLCPLLNSWLIWLPRHEADGNVLGTNGSCRAGVHVQVGHEFTSQWGLLSLLYEVTIRSWPPCWLSLNKSH